jgi:branched-chain amino acid transport system permease protein
MSSTEILQSIVAGLVSGSLIGVLAIGFALIFGVAGRFHFAYATSFVGAIYIAYHLAGAGVPLYLGVVGGILVAIAIGVACEFFLYRPLVLQSGVSGLLGVFVTSLGVVIVGTNVIELLWGSLAISLPTGYQISRISLGDGVGISNLDVVILAASLFITVATWAFLKYAKYGRAVRAVRENPDMATAIGAHPEQIYLVMFAVGSAVCGIAAILTAQQTAGTPDGGISPTFTALVAMFLAGVRSTPIAFMIAGLAIGLLQSVPTIWINGLWSPVLVFGVLFVYLALTPFFDHRTLRVPWSRLRDAGSTPEVEGA